MAKIIQKRDIIIEIYEQDIRGYCRNIEKNMLSRFCIILVGNKNSRVNLKKPWVILRLCLIP